MTIRALQGNIEHEKRIIEELLNFHSQYESLLRMEEITGVSNNEEKKIIKDIIDSLVSRLKIVNNAIPAILKEIKAYKELGHVQKRKKEKLISVKSPDIGEELVTVSKEERKKFLEELRKTNTNIKKLFEKREKRKNTQLLTEITSPNYFARIAAKIFFDKASKLAKLDYFKKLNTSLRQANIPYLLNTYIAMALLATLIAFLVSIPLLVLISFLHFTEGGLLISFSIQKLIKYSWLVIALPLTTFALFIMYPSSEKSAVNRKINEELPFVTIHMSAIAGSGIEPSRIFEIIMKSGEYPATTNEIKKLINFINLYGMDIVTALRETARITPSPKLAELFNGLATTIHTGGSLTEFLNEHAERLLVDYRLERERYTKTAETFMDIYISIVLAAPMLMLMVLILLQYTGINIGISIGMLTLLMVIGMVIINVVFLVFIHIRQPRY